MLVLAVPGVLGQLGHKERPEGAGQQDTASPKESTSVLTIDRVAFFQRFSSSQGLDQLVAQWSVLCATRRWSYNQILAGQGRSHIYGSELPYIFLLE